MKYAAVAFLFLAVVAIIVYLDKRKQKAIVAPFVPDGNPFPSVIEGRYVTPPEKAAIAARNTSLVKFGHPITGTDADNTTLGGGTPYGGIWISGSFKFVLDAVGQIVDAESWITVFDAVKHKVTGGLTASGQIGMSSASAGLNIYGNVQGGLVLGKVSESGMSVDVGGEDGLWAKLPLETQTNLEGIVNGPNIQYVHGVMEAKFSKT